MAVKNRFALFLLLSLISFGANADNPVPFVKFNPLYTYQVVDETTDIPLKQLYILKSRANGLVENDSLYIGGATIGLFVFHKTNREDKFGYFMRHPTPTNQSGNDSVEAVIHNFQLQFTGTPSDWFTLHSLILYNPMQSFGDGTITSLARNRLELRKGYILVGNLDKFPGYFSIGKMQTPFGLADTLNPFSPNTVGHIMSGLAFGTTVGFYKCGWDLAFMAIQGGQQFRAANSGRATPNKIENFAARASYEFDVREAHARVGGSYQKATAFCHAYPIMHFGPCVGHTPAWNAFAQFDYFNFEFIGEISSTTRDWPGTQNPYPPLNRFPAHKVQSFDVGGRYWFAMPCGRLGVSTTFGEYRAGPKGSPWQRQNQLVVGLNWMYMEHIKIFGEYVRTAGYSPLNFITGPNILDMNDHTQTHSDVTARSNILVLGMQIAI